MPRAWRRGPWEIRLAVGSALDRLLRRRDLRGNRALVGRDGHGAGAHGVADSHVLQRSGGSGPCYISEALDSSDLSRRDAGKVIALGCVNRSCNRLARLNGLEHLRSDAAALVVHVDALEREHIASYL